ncbi:uncharacterized protein LOC123293054 [Chrysoperla carnea]|uniref:uncharacterized protein LOC123293054 n=1 Tax=Chrysoperla carnea TaxID=189513 RepID=UPI001D094803|nr:uncharacterized protein LOC123293054 [Chrysoperla carnea]
MSDPYHWGSGHPPHCPPPHLSYPPGVAVCPPAPPCHGQDLMWVPSSADSVFPANAVKGGVDLDGADIFVGRAYHDGDLLPAKVIPANNVAYVCHSGREIAKHNFEVLCHRQLVWQYSSGGAVPHGAVPAGQTADGETLYIGRVMHEGTQTVGKVHPAHGNCYIPYNGEEIPHSDYEVLVLQFVQWVPTSAHAPFPPYAVRGGVDRDGTDIFVGRAFHEGDLIPAKVIPAKQIAYVAYDGREIMKHSFEVMCTSMYDQGRVTWRASHGSSIPYGAIPGGHTAQGETLYIGRVFHDGAQTVGKVHPSHGKCYIPYDGHEHHHHSYEVLVQI